MRKTIPILLTLIMLLTLSGCKHDIPEPEPKPVEPPAQIQEDIDIPPSSPTPEFWEGYTQGWASEYEMSNWAWAIPDWESEMATDALVATSYSSPNDLEDLTLAVGPAGMIDVSLDGEKEGNHDFSWPFYHPRFGSVTGPVWKPIGGSIPRDERYYFYDFLLLPASAKEKIIPLTYPSAPSNFDEEGPFFNHGYPSAEPEDIAKMEANRNGRKVMHSELLASTPDGGRISLFQFENIHYGLIVLAYINGEKIITFEETTNLYNDGTAMWGSEAMPDAIDLIRIAVLYQSDSGLVIGFSRYGLEAHGRYLLAEKDGKFIDFNFGDWDYRWYTENKSEFIQNTDAIFNSDAWPNIDPATLYGKWVDDYEFIFNPDGTGIRRAPDEDELAIKYWVDGNLLIIEDDFIFKHLFRIKIEENKLYIDMRSWDGKCHILTRVE